MAGLFDAFMSGNSGSAKESLGGLSDLLNYGNWCGPDNTKDDPNYPAIDKIDAACREHDLCLKNLGYHDCKFSCFLHLPPLPGTLSAPAVSGALT